MTLRRRAKAVLAASITIALIAGCDSTTPSPTPSAAASTASQTSPSSSAAASTAPTPAPSAGYTVSPARWSDCGKGYLCATIRVPREYDAPSNGYLEIALVRLSATDTAHRIGSLVVNPGGPGASGVDFVRQAGDATIFPAEIRKKFDIVGFDPRGVGVSSGIRCIDNLDPQARFDPSPDDPTELQQLVDQARDYAGECAKRNDATLPYLSTDAVVDDLELIRQAIGDEKLTYLGLSYGTLIGSLYADRYPDRVRAMVLDGPIDPALDLEQVRAGQADAFETALTHFFADCSARKACLFNEGGRSAAAFDALMAKIEKKSLPAPLAQTRRRVGPANLSWAVLGALYSKATWPVLAASLALAKRGDGSLLLQLSDPYQGRNPNGSYSNMRDAYTANTCLDFPAPTDIETFTAWKKSLDATAPHFAGLMAYNDIVCSFWPVPAERTPKPVRGTGAPPIVVVGTTGDPATPYAWATSLAGQLESAVLVTYEGEGHTAYVTDSCVQRAVDRYLLELTPPDDGTTCD